MKTVRTPIGALKGLANTSDPLSLDASWLQRADNCIITNRGKLVRSGGFTDRGTMATTGAYATDDQQRLYVASGGAIKQVQADLSLVTIAALTSTDTVRFAEVNGIVYYSNGTDYGALYPNGWRPWGIPAPAAPNVAARSGVLPAGKYQVCLTFMDPLGMESSNSNVAEIELPANSGLAITSIQQLANYSTCVYMTPSNDQVFKRISDAAGPNLVWSGSPEDMGIEIGSLWCNPPHGILPAIFGSRVYLADPYPTLDVSAIWTSRPIQYHLFDDGGEGMTVPGTVLMQAACGGAVIVGTERGIYAIDRDAEKQVTLLAPYGVVPGQHSDLYRGKLYFASLRGLCRALPFENLTENTYSFAPGTSAAGKVIEQQGFARYVMATHIGGTPYNAYQP